MEWVETAEGWRKLKVRAGTNLGREAMKELAQDMDVLGQPRPYLLCPPDKGAKRRAAARERRGKTGVRLLRQRCQRGDFGPKELDRRITQLWRSI